MRNLITYPNKILKLKSKDVKTFDKDLHMVLDNMLKVMKDKGGIGLAAIQIGVPLNAIIIQLPNKPLIEAINPVIVSSKGSKIKKEGCLSLPKMFSLISRANRIEVEFFDRKGNKKSMNATGLLARCFQHEMDHLEGKLYIDKLSDTFRKKFEEKYLKGR